MSGLVTDNYEETITASDLFTMPQSTFDFITCSMVDSSDNRPCPQGSISKKSTQ